MPLLLKFRVWPLLIRGLCVFVLTSAAPVINEADIKSRDENPGDIIKTPLSEKDPMLQKYQDFKKGLLFGALVLKFSSLKEDSNRICKMTYNANKGTMPDGQIELLTTSTNKDFRNMIQGFAPETVKGHNETYKALAWIDRGVYYPTRVIFTDYKCCTILRTEEYNNLCELFVAGRYDSDRVNGWCYFIYYVFCGPPAVSFQNLSECWPEAAA
uniref:Putative salivary lipocalin n=1 Tax=Ixodes ricinus TaxID=34613 RepID=A0A6B0V2C0_IXORI